MMALLGPHGLPLMCEAEDCGKLATGSYLNTLDRNVLCCADHNPYKILAEVTA